MQGWVREQPPGPVMQSNAQNPLVIALDQGTTSTRAIAFSTPQLVPQATARRDLPQHFPASGWVEHDAEDIFSHSVAVLREVMAASDAPIAAIGITNQRETTIVWDRRTGRAIHRAIVWQDRRTAAICAELRAAGHEAMVAATTGLLLDPYFSATKIAWILDTIPGARADAEAGHLAFGTVDCWLLWRLTAGRVHATDATNASRTALLDIHTGQWDDDLLALFRIPRAMLPEVRDCAAEFGLTDPDVLGRAIPIRGIAGDQQAATIGQACFAPGMVKSTYGTGCFLLLNTGPIAVASRNRLLTTIAYQLGGQRSYALEGAIFIAGAAVQWLRDGLGLIPSADQAEMLARQADPSQAVILVPAFTGLGAPYWDAEARGAIFGLTRNSGPAELAAATLHSVAFQTRDLIGAMQSDWPDAAPPVLRVDGGMVASDWTMQALADQLAAPVDRPRVLETTALGAAYLAALHSGLCPPPAEFAARWALERRFEPCLDRTGPDALYAKWRDAVKRTLS